MLTGIKFGAGINILKMAGIETELEQEKFYFDLLKNERIEDDEFVEACKLIVLNEKLYSKLPEPVIFCNYVLKVRELEAARKELLARQTPKLPQQAFTNSEKRKIQNKYRICAQVWKAYQNPAYQEIRGLKSLDKLPEKLHESFSDLPLEGIREMCRRLSCSDEFKQQSLKI
ncbi:MAG: hypothetical protein LBD41_05060 [Clostridiales Family XIII bacterium]|jgi:alpha-L-fucosidase|nr:hypothetical protein [Clostridiales Family XIII bacterium]